MKKFFLLSSATLLIASCGQTEKDAPEAGNTDTTADATKVTEPEVLTLTTCYTMVSKKDTINLNLTQEGNMVTGNMDYHWFEKDRNTGTIKGEMHGDTLVADYTFMSEGMESVRKEFLLKKGNDFVLGNIDYEHLQEPFKAKDIKFDGPLLKQVECKK